MAGEIVAVQVVAVELNPDPEKLTTELIVPDVGLTVMLAVTLNRA